VQTTRKILKGEHQELPGELPNAIEAVVRARRSESADQPDSSASSISGPAPAGPSRGRNSTPRNRRTPRRQDRSSGSMSRSVDDELKSAHRNSVDISLR
jgi:hypothetical protein